MRASSKAICCGGDDSGEEVWIEELNISMLIDISVVATGVIFT
jgi:hypothetical protein